MKEISKFFEYGNKHNPQYLVIMLHGYGSNGNDLISLAPELARSIDIDCHFIAPNAPNHLVNPFSTDSYQWFELGNNNPDILYPQIIEANNILDKFIAEKLDKANLGYDKLIFTGFSQGAMMSVYNAMRLKNKCAGVISFSGRLISPIDLSENINSKPDICLIHGDKDDVLPINYFFEAKKYLGKLDFNFEHHEIKNLGHSIDFASLKRAQNFLRKIIS